MALVLAAQAVEMTIRRPARAHQIADRVCEGLHEDQRLVAEAEVALAPPGHHGHAAAVHSGVGQSRPRHRLEGRDHAELGSSVEAGQRSGDPRAQDGVVHLARDGVAVNAETSSPRAGPSPHLPAKTWSPNAPMSAPSAAHHAHAGDHHCGVFHVGASSAAQMIGTCQLAGVM